MAKNLVCVGLFVTFLGFCGGDKGIAIQLKKTIEFFAEHYESSCISLLYENTYLREKIHEIQRLVRELARNMRDFVVVAMSFERFMRNRFKWSSMKCNSPLFVITRSDNETRSEMKKVAQTRLFHRMYWLVFFQSPVTDFFRDIATPFDLRLVAAIIGDANLIDFYEVYRVFRGQPLRTPYLGNWTSRGGFRIVTKNFYDRRHDLEGITLRTGSTESFPLQYFVDRADGRGKELRGYFPDVWRELEDLLNFTSVHYPSVDRVVGIPEEDGTWSGLVGMLEREEIDAAVTDFILDEQRSHVIDFTRPLLRTSYQIFFKNVGNNFNWDAILRPFEKRIWLTTAAWVVVSSAFSAVCHAWCHEHGAEGTAKRGDFNLINSALFFAQALCNQGHHLTPSSGGCRMIFLSAYIVAGVLVPSYSAALIYFLTSKSPMRPFDSLHDLLEIGTYKLQTMAKTAHYTYFSNSTDPLLHRIYEELVMRIPAEKMPYSMEEGIRNVCEDSTIAHFGDMANAVYFVNEVNSREGHCKIIHLSREISSVYSCMGLIRDSPYKSVIDHFLNKLTDRGVIDQIYRRTFPVHKMRGVAAKSWSAVEINDVLPIFVILVIGLLLAVVVLAAELCARPRKKRKKILRTKLSSSHLTPHKGVDGKRRVDIEKILKRQQR